MQSKTVLFCRVSSKEQEESGYSLPAQEKLLKEYAESRDLIATKIFSISESASGHKQRKIFQEMIQYLGEENIKIVVCEKIDRLTRNLKDAVMINDWLNEDEDRRIHFVKEGSELHKNSVSHEKFIWNIKVSTSQFYIDNLSEEVKKGQKEKLAQGWLPNRPPIGYKTIGDQGHKIHVPDENIAPLVKKMFDLYATGNYSLKKLTEAVYEIGLRSFTGKQLSKSRIHDYITDQFYIGKNCWNGIMSDGKQEIFIDEDVFHKVQSLLKRKNTPKYSKHHYLFQGMIKCGECGGQISWEQQKEHVYGHCNHYRNCTQEGSTREDKVEPQLVTALLKLKIDNPKVLAWVREALRETHKDQINFYECSLHELNERLQKAQKRLGKIYDDKIDEKITESFYEQKRREYVGEADSATTAIAKLTRANTKFHDLGVRLYDVAQNGEKIYYKTKGEPRRQLLTLVFDTLKLKNGEILYEYTKPFQMLYEAVKITNA